AAQLLEAPLHLAVARDDALHVVRPLRIRHGGFQLLQLGRHGAHRAGAVHHLVHGAAPRHLADVLVEVADGDTAIDRHLALVGVVLAGDHPEQRRFAGAVGTDEADLLPLLQRRGGLDEENLVAILLADVVETNHVRRGTPGMEEERTGMEEEWNSSGALLGHVPRRRKSVGGQSCPRWTAHPVLAPGWRAGSSGIRGIQVDARRIWDRRIRPTVVFATRGQPFWRRPPWPAWRQPPYCRHSWRFASLLPVDGHDA